MTRSTPKPASRLQTFAPQLRGCKLHQCGAGDILPQRISSAPGPIKRRFFLEFCWGRGGLVVRPRPWDRKVPGPRPDSTEDPPCMGPAAR
ncbi:hypothetical protein AVEN_165704-1 [Araneus ventricosus]|uniref:Uncharacterized protein n=1 Tax=Araneus ventricosus TaxID=182803 RepID=A0A4Y2C324_ARAVE|nr:hypothetical protein AVEN_165704-1 [Araneus ventricosus]